MAYGDFKHLNRKIFIYKVLRDKAFNIAKDPKYDRYHPGLASMVYKCFNENASGSRINTENISNKELAEELHKPIIRTFNMFHWYWKQICLSHSFKRQKRNYDY